MYGSSLSNMTILQKQASPSKQTKLAYFKRLSISDQFLTQRPGTVRCTGWHHPAITNVFTIMYKVIIVEIFKNPTTKQEINREMKSQICHLLPVSF